MNSIFKRKSVRQFRDLEIEDKKIEKLLKDDSFLKRVDSYSKKTNILYMKNRIKLTESQLHQVIKESVKNILKEYEWNNKTPEQDQAAIKAANTPASWKAHMMRANNQLDRENGYYNNKVGKLANKANDAFHDQYGTRYDYYEDNFDNGGGNSNIIRGTITLILFDDDVFVFNVNIKITLDICLTYFNLVFY